MEHHSIPVNATLQALAAARDVWTLDACGVTRSPNYSSPCPPGRLHAHDAVHTCLARRRALRAPGRRQLSLQHPGSLCGVGETIRVGRWR